MRVLFHPDTAALTPESLFHAFSDPVRLELVRQLAGGVEMSCGNFQVSQPKSSLSHHFKVLRESGVVRTRVEGTQRFITLRRVDLDLRFPGLLDAVLGAVGK